LRAVWILFIPAQAEGRFVVCVERINAVWHLEQQLRPFILSSSTYKQALSCERRHVASDQYSTSFYGRMIF